FARGFAELFAGLGDVEDVVDDLERESDVVAEGGEGLELRGGTVGAHAAEADGAAEQGGGFAFVNVFQLCGGNRFAFAFEVGHLAGDELERAGGACQFEHDVPMGVARPAAALRGDLERLGEEGVAGQNRDAFAEYFVVGEFAAAVIVVVHCGQDVVNERVGVDAFDGAGQGQGVLDGTAAGFSGGEAEGGAHAFAAGEEGVAHRLVNGRGPRGRFGQKAVERAVD